MNSQLKTRILGFLVLASLAIIFMPLVFDGTGVREREGMDMSIPPSPDMPDIVVNSPTREQLDQGLSKPAPIDPVPLTEITTNTTTNNTSNTNVSKTIAEKATQSPAAVKKQLSLAEEKPVLDQKGIPVAWTLQLASFKDKENAENLRSKLLKKGYKAYTRERDGLSKVFVGPDIQRSEVEKLRSQLKQEVKLDGLILRFTTQPN